MNECLVLLMALELGCVRRCRPNRRPTTPAARLNQQVPRGGPAVISSSSRPCFTIQRGGRPESVPTTGMHWWRERFALALVTRPRTLRASLVSSALRCGGRRAGGCGRRGCRRRLRADGQRDRRRGKQGGLHKTASGDSGFHSHRMSRQPWPNHIKVRWFVEGSFARVHLDTVLTI